MVPPAVTRSLPRTRTALGLGRRMGLSLCFMILTRRGPAPGWTFVLGAPAGSRGLGKAVARCAREVPAALVVLLLRSAGLLLRSAAAGFQMTSSLPICWT